MRPARVRPHAQRQRRSRFPDALADLQRNAGGTRDLLHDMGQASTDSVGADRVFHRGRQQTGHHQARLGLEAR